MLEKGLNQPGRFLAPLTLIEPERRVLIRSIVGGRGQKRHLVDIGLRIGAVIEVISKGMPGHLLIRSGDTRLAVSRGIAWRILVENVR